jgi:hypothetical protein
MEFILYPGKNLGVSLEYFKNVKVRSGSQLEHLSQSFCNICQVSTRVRGSLEREYRKRISRLFANCVQELI